MHRVLAAVLLTACTATAGAAAPAANNGVQSMLEQGQSITRERRSLEAQQAKLLKQKTDLDTAAQALNQQQAALNQEIEANNQAITQQGSKTSQTQTDCKQGETSGSSQTGDCNKDIKTLNVSRADLKAQQDALKQRQADLDAASQRHAQDAEAWNSQEQKTVARLNAVYQGQNNWVDAANSLIGSDSFQTLAGQAGAGTRCTNTVPKGDRLTSAMLQKYADAIVGCLSWVAKHAGDAPG